MGACSTIPLLGIHLSANAMVALMAALSGLALVMETARLVHPRLNRVLVRWLTPLLKDRESRNVTGATYIALSALVAFLIFDKPIAITALFFLAVGDPVAALVGSKIGGMRLRGKSPYGTLAFLTVSLAIAGVLAGTEVVSFHWGLVIGAAVAALVELAPSALDDNLTIPLISGAAMTFMGV